VLEILFKNLYKYIKKQLYIIYCIWMRVVGLRWFGCICMYLKNHAIMR